MHSCHSVHAYVAMVTHNMIGFADDKLVGMHVDWLCCTDCAYRMGAGLAVVLNGKGPLDGGPVSTLMSPEGRHPNESDFAEQGQTARFGPGFNASKGPRGFGT